MKKLLSVCLSAMLMFGSVGVSPITTLANSLEVESPSGLVTGERFEWKDYHFEGLAYVNELRRGMGYDEVVLDEYLTKAAINMAEYVALHGLDADKDILAHMQEEGAELFTGVWDTDRLRYVNAPKTHLLPVEIIGLTGNRHDSMETRIKNFFDSPAHRISIVHWATKKVGMGISKDVLVMLFYVESSPEYVDNPPVTEPLVFPYDGQVLDFLGSKKDANKDGHYGVPITFDVPMTFIEKDEIELVMRNSRGDEVPVEWYNYSGFEVGTMLEQGETYNLVARYLKNNEWHEHKWSFSTKQAELPNDRPDLAMLHYSDFDEDAYWSEDFRWLYSKGLMGGFSGKHPDRLEYGEFIAPYSKLTEAQFLKILMSYDKPYEYKLVNEQLIRDGAKYVGERYDWSKAGYILAEKYNLPVKGSSSNTALGSNQMTRGQVAVIMATLSTGKKMTEREAVQWMYDNGITEGKLVNGTVPKTFESFGVNDGLQRAHVMAFIKRYHDNVKMKSVN